MPFVMRTQDVQIQSGDLKLRGEIYFPDRTPSPGILVCHAMHAQGFRWLPLYRTFAQSAARKGFTCLLFDFRGCGLSEGQFDYGWGEQQDARAAFRFLAERNEVGGSCCFIMGRSLGGTIAVYSLLDEPRVKGFALWATPPDHRINVRNFIVKNHGRLAYVAFRLLSAVGAGKSFDLFGLTLRPRDLNAKLVQLKPYERLSSGNHPPVLLLVGDKDDYVTLSEVKNFERSITEPKRLVVLPGTGHTFKDAETQAISLTLDWFQRLAELCASSEGR